MTEDQDTVRRALVDAGTDISEFRIQNECPEPADYVAVQKHWFDRYGAEIVCVSVDVVKMRVTRPPTNRADAMELAREQFLCSGGGLVFQGVATMSALDASLVRCRVWSFWWD